MCVGKKTNHLIMATTPIRITKDYLVDLYRANQDKRRLKIDNVIQEMLKRFESSIMHDCVNTTSFVFGSIDLIESKENLTSLEESLKEMGFTYNIEKRHKKSPTCNCGLAIPCSSYHVISFK